MLKKKKKTSARPVPEENGVIVAHYGIAVEVLFDSGVRRKVKVKRNSGHVVGDSVGVREHRLSRAPRRTELSRRDSRGSVRVVGANLDVVGIVVSPLPKPTPGYIDQAIVCARQADLTPVLVINKSDLGDAPAFIDAIRSVYDDILDMFVVSALTGDGLERLTGWLGEGRRGFFVGVSGVGKSSLLNAICPTLDLGVGEIYEAGGRGCNKTTVSTLHLLPTGGELVDTPGFNEFGLVDITADTLADVFPGFEPVPPGACRFRNCRHRTEPGCAVRQMIKAGEILQERYDAYIHTLDLVEQGDARFHIRR